MVRCGMAFGLLLVLLACSTVFLAPTLTPAPTVAWQDTLDEMAALTHPHRLAVPEHLEQADAEKTGEEFDVNEYFTVLTHISPETGYVLDYVYHYDSFAGGPLMYARQEEEPGYATFSEYEEAVGDPFGEARGEYLEHVQVDGTAEGFFELVVLAIQGEQFYLYWHANYDDSTVIGSREAAEAVIEAASEFGSPLTSEQEREALRLDFEPRVAFEEETVSVRIVTFSKWGGFFEDVYTISREFPHQILEHEWEELVSYNCGVMF
jgi:hypothetical protein